MERAYPLVPSGRWLHGTAWLRASARLGRGPQDRRGLHDLAGPGRVGVHGTSITGQDDRDKMGLCLEPPEFVTGLARVRATETQVARTPMAPSLTCPTRACHARRPSLLVRPVLPRSRPARSPGRPRGPRWARGPS